MGNSFEQQKLRKRRVKFSKSTMEFKSIDSTESQKAQPVNTDNLIIESAEFSSKRIIENLVEELYTTSGRNRENYLNARLLIHEPFFSADTVFSFENAPSCLSSSVPQSSVSNNNDHNNTEDLTFKRFSRQFKRCHKLNFAKFSQTVSEADLHFAAAAAANEMSSNESHQPELDLQNSPLAAYRVLLYSESFDIYTSTKFLQRKKALKKIRRSRILLMGISSSYIALPSLGDKLFASGSSTLCTDKHFIYCCLAYYPFVAKVIEFTMVEIACLRLLYNSGQLTVNRRFWFALFDLLYESAALFAEYWQGNSTNSSNSTLSLSYTTKNNAHSSLSATERKLRSNVRLQAFLGLEVRYLFELHSSAAEALAEKISSEVITFATVVLAMPPRVGVIGIVGGQSRDQPWDDLIEDYYEACKGRRPFFFRRRSSK